MQGNAQPSECVEIILWVTIMLSLPCSNFHTLIIVVLFKSRHSCQFIAFQIEIDSEQCASFFLSSDCTVNSVYVAYVAICINLFFANKILFFSMIVITRPSCNWTVLIFFSILFLS